MANKREAGFSLIELVVVLGLMGILMGITGFSVRTLQKRYEAEGQVRSMHVDMLRTRYRAFQLNRSHYVTVTRYSYQITEDTNSSGNSVPDGDDKPLWPEPKHLRYPSQWEGILVVDGRGIISKSTGPLLNTSALAIRFDSADIDAAYDCIAIGPTRLRVGKWIGAKCMAQ